MKTVITGHIFVQSLMFPLHQRAGVLHKCETWAKKFLSLKSEEDIGQSRPPPFKICLTSLSSRVRSDLSHTEASHYASLCRYGLSGRSGKPITRILSRSAVMQPHSNTQQSHFYDEMANQPTKRPSEERRNCLRTEVPHCFISSPADAKLLYWVQSRRASIRAAFKTVAEGAVEA